MQRIYVEHVAIDIGYGDVKVMHKSKLFKFPTAISRVKESYTNVGDNVGYDYNGKRYLVGERVKDGAISTRGYDFLSKYSPLLVHHALTLLGLAGAKGTKLSIGLSLVDWDAHSDAYLDSLRKIHVDGVTTNLVPQLYAQGQGIYNTIGKPQGRVLIVDIGYNTVDLLYFEDGKPRKDLSSANKGGANKVITEIQTHLGKRFGVDFSEQEAKAAFLAKGVKVLGEWVDLTDMISAEKEEYVEYILGELMRRFEKVLTVTDLVVISGGGAYFFDGVAIPKNFKLDENEHEFSNVRGYYHGE